MLIKNIVMRSDFIDFTKGIEWRKTQKKKIDQKVLPLDGEPSSICAPMSESACRPVRRHAFSHHPIRGYFCSLARARLIKSVREFVALIGTSCKFESGANSMFRVPISRCGVGTARSAL